MGLLDQDSYDLGNLDFAALNRLRAMNHEANGGQDMQDLLAGYEHRAMNRELTQADPMEAVRLAIATPVYQIAKLLGATNSRSAPSWSQLGQGYTGIAEGLLKNWGNK